MDGLAIGYAFILGPKIAFIVSVAVIIHKLGDGIGLVSLMIHHKNSRRKTLSFLIVDSLVPVLGIFLANIITVSSTFLGLILSFFAGFFIYMGAADLLPEAHRQDTSFTVLLSTLSGFLLVYLLNIFTAF